MEGCKYLGTSLVLVFHKPISVQTGKDCGGDHHGKGAPLLGMSLVLVGHEAGVKRDWGADGDVQAEWNWILDRSGRGREEEGLGLQVGRTSAKLGHLAGCPFLDSSWIPISGHLSSI